MGAAFGDLGGMMQKEIIGNATLYCGDCMEVLPTLDKVDAVITDPPYGIGADKANAHSSIRDDPSWRDTGWDNHRPSDSLLRVLPGLAGTVAIWGGNYFADCLPPSSGWLIWRKPEAETGFSLADAEMCWTSKPFAARMKTIPRRDGNLHPTQKPGAVMSWTMTHLKVPEYGTVLAPVMGSGPTGVACINLDRKFIGIEIDPHYFDIACERIHRAQQQLKLAL